jgi:transcriptional regulator with XRE-family HTH domain
MSQDDAQVRNVKQVRRGPLGVVPTGEQQEPKRMRSEASLDRRTKEIVKRVNERREEVGLTQEGLAAKAGLNVSALRSKLLYRTGAAPDLTMLGSISVALGWHVEYLPGLWDGDYDFDTDPFNPEEEKPEPRKTWHSPELTPSTREAALEKTVRVQGAKIRTLEAGLAELRSIVDELTGGAHRKRAV